LLQRNDLRRNFNETTLYNSYVSDIVTTL